MADRGEASMTLTETIVWVPVGERLPDVDIVVLIHPDTHYGHRGYLNGRWYDEHGEPCDVTHWAELPKGPKP